MKSIKVWDGINIVFALQGSGKTYTCTYLAYMMLLLGKKKVLTNYPIIFERPLSFKQKLINFILKITKKDILQLLRYTLVKQIPEILQTYKWNDEYTGTAIKDALIIIDESHDKYTGAYASELNKHDRKFFSRLRHNGNSVYLMSQSFDDLHPFIRRRTAYLHEIKKRKWIFFKNPSCFFIETYTTVKDYMNKDMYKFNKNVDKTIFMKQKIPFDMKVASSYNTHYFRDIKEEPVLELWSDVLEGKTITSKFNMEYDEIEDNGNGKKGKNKSVKDKIVIEI